MDYQLDVDKFKRSLGTTTKTIVGRSRGSHPSIIIFNKVNLAYLSTFEK